MMRLFSLLLLLLPGLFWGQAFAQTPYRFSLAEAQALWQQNNREVRLARAAVAGAEADLRTAGQTPNPQLSLNLLSISPWSGYRAGGWEKKKMDTALRLDQVLERGGKKALRIKEAESQLAASRRDVDEAARSQRLALHNAYYDLLLAQERQRITTEAADLYGKSLAAGKLRLKVGDVSQVDFSRLQIEKLRAENEARQAQADLELAQSALAYLIGRENEPRLVLAGDAWPALAETESAAVELESRPDIEAARLRVAAAEAARDLARAQQKRDVTVGVQVEHNLQNAPTNSYGFGVSVPLFLWHEYEGEVARAEADLEIARQQLARTQAQAAGDVDQAGSALKSAQARRQRLETGLLADAEKVARAAEFAYGKGAMSLMDLLDARRTWRQVQIEAATARADHAKALSAWRLQAAYEGETQKP